MVNGSMLEWARVEAGYALEQVAEKLRQSVEKLRAWESGEAQPSLILIQELRDWLMDHIAREDAAFAEYLRNIQGPSE